MSVARRLALLPLGAAMIAPILVTDTVAHYGLNVPYWDQWSFVPLLVDATEGHLRLSALWAQHNEHRILLPRLAMLGLARLTGWNVRAELFAGIVLQLGTLGVLAFLIRRSVRPFFPAAVPWLVGLAATLLFSLSQWENWTWGWQMSIFMAVFTVAVAAWLLARWDGRWPGLVLLLAAAVVNVLCFASGFVLLALVPLAVLVRPGSEVPRRRLLAASVATAVFAGAAALYLTGFAYPEHHPAPSFVVAHPRVYLQYVLTYVGGSFGSSGAEVAARWGATGIALFAAAVAWLWSRSTALRAALLPWLLLALYTVGSAGITGLGRAGFGADQAVGSRYITLSVPFWVSLGVVGSLALARLLRDPHAMPLRTAVVGVLVGVGFTLAAHGYVASWAAGRAHIKAHRDLLRRGGSCLLRYEDAPDACLRRLFPSPEWVRQQARRLERHGLGPFAVSVAGAPAGRDAPGEGANPVRDRRDASGQSSGCRRAPTRAST